MGNRSEKQPLVFPDRVEPRRGRLESILRAIPVTNSGPRWIPFLCCFILLTLPHWSRYSIGDTSIVQPLSPEFKTRCEDLLIPPEGTYTSRISRLANSLEEDTLWIAEPGTSAEYFLGGFSSRDWWLSERPLLTIISSSGDVIILTAKFEQSRAEMVNLPKELKERTTFVPWLESESPYRILSDHFGSTKKGKRMVLDAQVRSFIASGLRELGWSEASEEEIERVRELRERKDEREIGLLRCANQVSGCSPLSTFEKHQLTCS